MPIPRHPIRHFWLSLALSLSGSLYGLQAYAEDIYVFAAASLTDAVNELASQYAAQHPGINIKTSYAGSSALAKQIEQGAPADVFLSADSDWADYLDQRHLLRAGSRTNLLTNDLVLVTPKGREFTAEMSPGFNLPAAFSGKLCTGDVSSVPVGKYAQQSLTYFGWWKALEPRMVGTENVRMAAAFVERGECGAGIIYRTDFMLSHQLSLVASFPGNSHKPIVYPGALTINANAASQGFWNYLQTSTAEAVFTRYGFTRIH